MWILEWALQFSNWHMKTRRHTYPLRPRRFFFQSHPYLFKGKILQHYITLCNITQLIEVLEAKLVSPTDCHSDCQSSLSKRLGDLWQVSERWTGLRHNLLPKRSEFFKKIKDSKRSKVVPLARPFSYFLLPVLAYTVMASTVCFSMPLLGGTSRRLFDKSFPHLREALPDVSWTCLGYWLLD